MIHFHLVKLKLNQMKTKLLQNNILLRMTIRPGNILFISKCLSHLQNSRTSLSTKTLHLEAHVTDPKSINPTIKSNKGLQISRDHRLKTVIISLMLLRHRHKWEKREPKARTKRMKKIKKRRSRRRTKKRGMAIIIEMVKRRGRRVKARGKNSRREKSDYYRGKY